MYLNYTVHTTIDSISMSSTDLGGNLYCPNFFGHWAKECLSKMFNKQRDIE